jgi:ribulose-bisphosphate carboxylase large chain
MARFTVVYSLAATDSADARKQAFDLAVEQTLEFPHDLVTDPHIRDEIVGRVEALEPLPSGRFQVTVSYDEATAGLEFTQFLNVVFGNTSLKPGVRVESLAPTAAQTAAFRGPQFGVEGLRHLLGVHHRPLLCSAIKPMGLSVASLADLAHRFALGGIDFIKDDHGLADQAFSPFQQRISACMEAVRRANLQTGRRCLYIPNVTADGSQTLARARFAKQAGAAAIIISGALTGLSTLREVALDPQVGLPVFFHPALSGCYTISPTSGFSHFAFFGQLLRLACADAIIFPNFGGRFSFSREECAAIAAGCRSPIPAVRTALPAPGGGLGFHNVRDLINFYGRDAVFLMGGGLFRHNPDLTRSVADLLQLVEDEVAATPHAD